ncbi:MAG: DUF1080 domain-containing protein, partial [Verrucomicrobiales bacterium]|nr:DUF1080 domain-containing protein [Verrucomicrobiales bacterium]
MRRRRRGLVQAGRPRVAQKGGVTRGDERCAHESLQGHGRAGFSVTGSSGSSLVKPLLAAVGLLAALVVAPELHAASRSLFDGKTFAGWEGDTAKTFRIVDGTIQAGSLTEMVPRNVFLATTSRYTNFVLRLKVKLTGTEGFVNSGVPIRSER